MEQYNPALYITDDQGRVRVKIIRAGGTPLGLGGLTAADPEKAQQHFDEFGWCEPNAKYESSYTNPRITLDDGTVIWGFECWWTPQTTDLGKMRDAELDQASADFHRAVDAIYDKYDAIVKTA